MYQYLVSNYNPGLYTPLFILFFVVNCRPEGQNREQAVLKASVSDSIGLVDIYQKAEEIGSVSGLLIQKREVQIAEEYFHGMQPGQMVNIKSAAKSIMSLLIGIALDRGILQSKRQPIRDFFPEYLSEGSDPDKLAITIEDLLTMRAGLETTSRDNYGRWVTSSNWVRYILEQPVVGKPGSGRMVYSTGSSHLLSVILTRASGMSTRDFAQKYLFGPLGIRPGGWDRDPQGYYMGGNNLSLKPSDMLKIGQLVLNGGVYKGEQIVSEAWLRDSFKTYTQSNYNPYDYGYMWWKQEIGGYQALFAWGWGGQYIFMFPELESVVVVTSFRNIATQERAYKAPVFELVREYIIPGLLIGKSPELGSRKERYKKGNQNTDETDRADGHRNIIN